MDDSVIEVRPRVLFFAKARELTGTRECEISVPKRISCSELTDLVIKKFKLESIRNSVILAVNEEFVSADATLVFSEHDEIAVIPPLSGGAPNIVFSCILIGGAQRNLLEFTELTFDETEKLLLLALETSRNVMKSLARMKSPKDIVKLQQEPLDVGEIFNSVISPVCGAVSNFIGITRDNFEDKKVLKLEYEAYEPMALKEMTNICAKIRSQWKVHHIAIYHRLGEVPVSEASVAIAVSSSHRQESLKAVEFAIDALKASVPIWKKEVYDTEESQWKENQECAWSNKNRLIPQQNIKQEVIIPNDNADGCGEHVKLGDNESDEDEVEENPVIDRNLVQIQASAQELNHRIESFIERKRQQVNTVNIQEFCCHRDKSDESEDSCARVDAILIRRKDSKSHVKVHRVLNAWGPQTVDQSFLQKFTSPSTNPAFKPFSTVLDDRVSTAERILGINRPVPKDVYERLKNIEDRILYLEGVSPEYKNFWVTDEIDSLKGTFKPSRKRTYSTAELDSKLYELADKYAKKAK